MKRGIDPLLRNRRVDREHEQSRIAVGQASQSLDDSTQALQTLETLRRHGVRAGKDAKLLLSPACERDMNSRNALRRWGNSGLGIGAGDREGEWSLSHTLSLYSPLSPSLLTVCECERVVRRQRLACETCATLMRSQNNIRLFNAADGRWNFGTNHSIAPQNRVKRARIVPAETTTEARLLSGSALIPPSRTPASQ